MERREFIAAAAATAATLTTATAFAQGHAHAGKLPPSPPLTKAQRAVIDGASDCIKAGELCLAHCADNLAAGDAAMADCQRSVMNMLAVCRAMVSVASYRSAPPADLKAMARTCAGFCRSCEKACEKHAAHHDECKRCMESCRACARACDDLGR